MRIIKAETFLKPIPETNWTIEDDNTRYVIFPITGNDGRPNVTKFKFRPRSYVFGVFSGVDTWFQVKYDKTGLPVKFDLPGELILNPRPYRVFAAYNDGFLGGTFTPGYYSLKEKIQYWYCLGQTKPGVSLHTYFLRYNEELLDSEFPVVIDLSKALASPESTVWRKYKVGDPISIGFKIRVGDSYDE
jgi:hypothetical protein